MKSKVLNLLRQSTASLSGEALSESLGVTRAAIWKAVQALRQDGYGIEAVPNRGYRLISVPDALYEDEILDGLQTQTLGRKVYHYKETGSTNAQAKVEAERGAPDGSVFLAECQTAGRGRLGRCWASPAGEGIWMSLLLRPDAAPQAILPITLVTGLAVANALRQEGVDALIKWPNDIVAHGKKLCGILTEMSAEAEGIRHVVVGIGINVNTPQFPEELRGTATSLRLQSGREHSRKALVQRILMECETAFYTLLGQGFEPMREEYRALSATLGHQVQAINRTGIVVGLARDVTDSGDLIIETPDGLVTVTSGEVSVRGIYGYT